jgi:glycosyltransferase involved in cell wall biosynthesis
MGTSAPTSSDQASPWITVAICTRNRAGLLREAVRSVLPQLGHDAELLLVDNASTDETAAWAQQCAGTDPRIRFLSHTQPGLSQARNRALAEARGSWVLFLDDDATARAGWLDAYRQFVQNPSVARAAAVGGRVYPRYEKPPPVWIGARENLLDRGDQMAPFDDRGAPWGCNLAVARASTLQCGGFNPALGRKGQSLMSAEETELCHRLRRAGHEVWWLPQAEIDHRVAAERLTIACVLRMLFCLGRSAALIRLQMIPDPWRRLAFRVLRLMLTPLHLLFYLVASVAVLLCGRLCPAARLFFRSARAMGFAYQLILGGG